MNLQNTTQLFISHSSRDVELARLLVTMIDSFFSVPNRAILCSSVEGYELPLGGLLSHELRARLNSTGLLISLLSLNSLNSDWVLFEIGAAWGNDTYTVPLLVGDLSKEDLPAALKERTFGRISERNNLINLVTVIQDRLGWTMRNHSAGDASISNLVEAANRVCLSQTPKTILNELQKGYHKKLESLSDIQKEILNYIQSKDYLVSDTEIHNFRNSSISELYYRLENLRMLGFIEKQKIGGSSYRPEHGYRITREYLNYIQLK